MWPGGRGLQLGSVGEFGALVGLAFLVVWIVLGRERSELGEDRDKELH